MMNKLRKFIKNPKVRFGYLSRLGLLNWMSDEVFLKKKYRLVMGRDLNLENPQTFNEKIQWLKIHERNYFYTKLVDKYEVKDYLAQKIGRDYIIPTIGCAYEKFDDIDFDKLPGQFVVKCTHDSGGLVICKDKAFFDKKEAKKKINRALRRNYYYSSREWPYKNVKPRIIVEKYMEEMGEDELIDYKVMCFGGKAKMIFTCSERFGDGLKVTFFDLAWHKLPFKRHYPVSKKNIPKPKNLKKMIELSEKLADGMTFVRIDWYEINGRLYFGEYTFYPGSGMEEFTPEEWDRKLGDMIDLSKIKNEGK